MESPKNLLEVYASADEVQRLSLFLTHRNLRRLFTEIDLRTVAQPEMAQPARRRLSDLFCRWRWLKQCGVAK